MSTQAIRTEQGGLPTGGTAGQVPVKQSGTDYDVAWGAGGGGSPGASLISSSGYLPIGKTYNNNSGLSGTAPSGIVFTDSASARMFVVINAGVSSDGTNNTLRCFKNDFGSYYEEYEVNIARADFTQPIGTNGSYDCRWATDGTYVYAWCYYQETGSNNEAGVDVFRYDIDGTNRVRTTIFAVPDRSVYPRNTFEWFDTVPGESDARAMCIVGSSFFVTWTVENPAGVYAVQFREYSIAGTVYTLVNTYTVTQADANDGVNGFQLCYDSSTSTFYLLTDTDPTLGDIPSMVKYQIVGPALTQTGAHISYSYFDYGNMTDNLNHGYLMSNVEFGITSYNIFITQYFLDRSYSGSSSSETTTYMLEVRTLAKL